MLEWLDTPFLLVASGEPVYVGVFSTMHSSSAYEEPVIKPSEDVFIRTDSTNNVKFSIGIVQSATIQPTIGTNQISKDVLNDARILGAIKKLSLEGASK